VFFSLHGEGWSLHEILVSLFLFITAPISAHLLAKAALHRRLPSLVALPPEFDAAVSTVAGPKPDAPPPVRPAD
jgi:multicomponent K+:H+ antiporter subunit G